MEVVFGGMGATLSVPADGCVRVRAAFPTWWGSSRNMLVQSPGGDFFPVPFTWSQEGLHYYLQ